MTAPSAADLAATVQLCETCGKAHVERIISVRNGKPWERSWADPDDGHPFKRESWESVARRLEARVAELDGGACRPGRPAGPLPGLEGTR